MRHSLTDIFNRPNMGKGNNKMTNITREYVEKHNIKSQLTIEKLSTMPGHFIKFHSLDDAGKITTIGLETIKDSGEIVYYSISGHNNMEYWTVDNWTEFHRIELGEPCAAICYHWTVAR